MRRLVVLRLLSFAVFLLVTVAGILFAFTPATQPAKQPPALDSSKTHFDGIVVDEADKPVAGATVQTLRESHTWKLTHVQTAADGTFRLALEPDAVDFQMLVASVENGARQGIAELPDAAPKQAAPIRIIVKPSQKLTVSVNDAAKKPVPGAAVGILFWPGLVAQGETDAKGMATLQLPADADEVKQIVALKPKVGVEWLTVAGKESGGVLPGQVSLTLAGATSVSIKAVDSEGKPLPGVDFIPSYIFKPLHLPGLMLDGAIALKHVVAKTNNDGIATFDWLPTTISGGGIPFFSLHHEFSTPKAPHVESLPVNEPLIARLLRNVPISGKVTLPDGKPAAGVLLQAEGTGATRHFFRSVTRTKADGSYAFLAYPDQAYIVAVTDENWAAASKTGIVLSKGKPRADLDFQLSKGTVIRGIVTAATDKKPTAGAVIEVTEQGKSLPAGFSEDKNSRETLTRRVTTDAEGRYAIRVGPGNFKISGPPHEKVENITVKAEETIIRDFQSD